MELDTKKDLEMCEKATKGPWENKFIAKIKTISIINRKCGVEFEIAAIDELEEGCITEAKHDAEFIATSREALPYYIKAYQAEKERAEKAEAENKKLRQALFCKVCGGKGKRGAYGPCPTCGKLREELRREKE